MRYIDIQIWPRRNHFSLYSTFNHPHFNMCVDVDVTAFHPFVKRNGHSLTVSMVYIIARASHAISTPRQFSGLKSFPIPAPVHCHPSRGMQYLWAPQTPPCTF